MIKERAMELVAALRSGEYKQTRGWLRDKHGYCCLGVACNLVASDKWSLVPATNSRFIFDKESESLLPGDVMKHFGFNSNDGYPIKGSIEMGGKEYHSLTDANDAGHSFAEIADYIEANWENL